MKFVIGLCIITLSPLSFWNGPFHLWIWTHPLLQIGIHSKINNTMANSVDPDETAHYEPSHLWLHFSKASVLVCIDEKVKEVYDDSGIIFSISP